MTGLSGSGKSSLAFDTIYAEGQRRYVESLSAYARQFLGQMDKPDVDSIEGLSPAISIDQKTTSRNPRSTVGTVTEIYDYLRLLWSRIGKPHCFKCGAPISGPVDRADHRPGDDARRGHEVHGARAGRPRAQGRVREAARGDAPAGLRPGGRRRRAAPPRRGDQARQALQARHLDRHRPARDEGGHPQAARRVDRGGVRAGRRPGRGRADRGRGGGRRRADALRAERRQARRGARLQREVRLPQLRHVDARDRAADLLLQLAARRLRALPRARLPAGDRSRALRARPDALDLRGRAVLVDGGGVPVLPAAARGRLRGARRRHRHAVAGPLRCRPRSPARGHGHGAPHDLLQEPLRPPAPVHGALRGDRRRARAALREHRLGEDARRRSRG